MQKKKSFIQFNILKPLKSLITSIVIMCYETNILTQILLRAFWTILIKWKKLHEQYS